MKTFLIAFTFVLMGLTFIRAEEKKSTSTSSNRSIARTDAIQEWGKVIAKVKVDKKIPKDLFFLAEKVVQENEFHLDQMAEELSLLMKENEAVSKTINNLWNDYPNKSKLTSETQDGFENIMQRAKRLMKTGQDAG